MKKFLDKWEDVDEDSARFNNDKARKETDAQTNKTYYTSANFFKQVGSSTMIEGVKMGYQQVLGLILAEFVHGVVNEIKICIDVARFRFMKLEKALYLLRSVSQTP